MYEQPLPPGKPFLERDGTRQTDVRLRWWLDSADITYREVALIDDPTRMSIPDHPLEEGSLPGYPTEHSPVYMGHYWLKGIPELLAPNVACLDYSVACGGLLVAYRWDGEAALDSEKFVTVVAGRQ